MNAHTSTGTPVCWTTSTIGAMSETSVRQATFAPIERPFRLPHERQDVLPRARARARQPDVRRVDAELVHEMEEADLLLEARILHGRALEPVPERLVVELDRGAGLAVGAVPVVDQVVVPGLVHAAFGRAL
jgi:hypothetical protein